MQSTLSYSPALRGEYLIRLVYVHIMDVLDIKISSNFLDDSSCGTFLHYVRVDNMMIKQKDILNLVQKKATYSCVAKSLPIVKLIS